MAAIGFAGISYRWFIGQVPPDQNQHSKNATASEAWSERVKVRIPGIHDTCEVSDENLPWAIVARPTSQGSFNYGSSGIHGGEWVIGFFMDEANQIPVITHVLGKNKTEFDITTSQGCTNFSSVNRYNSNFAATANHTDAGPESDSYAGTDLTASDFEAAKVQEKEIIEA